MRLPRSNTITQMTVGSAGVLRAVRSRMPVARDSCWHRLAMSVLAMSVSARPRSPCS